MVENRGTVIYVLHVKRLAFGGMRWLCIKSTVTFCVLKCFSIFNADRLTRVLIKFSVRYSINYFKYRATKSHSTLNSEKNAIVYCDKNLVLQSINSLFFSSIQIYKVMSLMYTENNIACILEKICEIRSQDFCQKIFFADNQFGFRRKLSTAIALAYLNEQISTALDNGLSTIGILIDLKKSIQ